MLPDPFTRPALVVRDVSRRFVAGAGHCTVDVAALVGASVEIRPAEILVVAGPIGAGKTTLMLCVAGLLRCDAGEIHGEARVVVYRDLRQPARPIPTLAPGAVLLLDECDDLPDLPRARATRVIAQAVAAGAAVVLAARDAQACIALAPPAATLSVVHLRLGRTSTVERVGITGRVAEGLAGSY